MVAGRYPLRVALEVARALRPDRVESPIDERLAQLTIDDPLAPGRPSPPRYPRTAVGPCGARQATTTPSPTSSWQTVALPSSVKR